MEKFVSLIYKYTYIFETTSANFFSNGIHEGKGSGMIINMKCMKLSPKCICIRMQILWEMSGSSDPILYFQLKEEETLKINFLEQTLRMLIIYLYLIFNIYFFTILIVHL